eukprot:GFUD01131124.1.p1 GENE.GFUD01131124.1~~GFUD01131124.1.p1  ORF type:complete len:128 (+),score=30.21 GFUD01131124.1:34-417(+)
MPHICGPHSNLPNCRYYDQYITEQNPNWVPAAGTGTMDKQKTFPRLQMNQRWEPKSNNEEPEKEKEPKEILIQIERGPAVRQGDEDNWAGKKKSEILAYKCYKLGFLPIIDWFYFIYSSPKPTKSNI